MKNRFFILMLFLLMSGFVLGQPSAPVGTEDYEKVTGIIGNYSPLDSSGDVNFSKYSPFRTRAEARIAQINEYVGPITRVLWGVELTMSWVFVFAFVVWILLIELIIIPVSSIFDWDIWWTLIGAGIIATLAMQGFGKDLVVWMESLMTQWWIGFVVLFGAFIAGALYSIFFKKIKKMADKAKEKDEKMRTARDRKILSVEAELIKDSLGN